MDDLDTFTLTLSLGGKGDIDQGDLDALSRSLCSELEELPFVKDVELGTSAGGDVPAGAKAAAEIATIGSLLMAILPGAVPKLLEYLKDWVSRPDAVPVTIKVQAGDRVVEAEFDPEKTSIESVEQLAANLLGAMHREAKLGLNN